MPRKGQISRTVCAVDNCPNPLHVYPNGARVKYCKDHLHLRKGKMRGNVNITGAMETVLRLLRDVHQSDSPSFVMLPPETSVRTIETLVERDWIYSGDHAGKYYRITGRGLAILAKCDKQVLRRDGICFKCGIRPRHINGSGKRESYCYECERERCNAKTQRGRRKTPTDPCDHCKD